MKTKSDDFLDIIRKENLKNLSLTVQQEWQMEIGRDLPNGLVQILDRI